MNTPLMPMLKPDPNEPGRLIVTCHHCRQDWSVIDTPENRDLIFCSIPCSIRWAVKLNRFTILIKYTVASGRRHDVLECSGYSFKNGLVELKTSESEARFINLSIIDEIVIKDSLAP